VPAFLVEHARAFETSGTAPVTPRTAATVVMLRQVGDTIEAYVQQRAATMAFAPGFYAFPGGSVDPRDRDAEVGWVGRPVSWWGERLGLAPAEAQAVVCAAVREVFEESGVLLAGPDEATVVADASTQEWEQARLALLAREVSLAELLSSRKLLLRADLLTPWARWLTPEFEPRRFDTFFFVAGLPDRQRPRDVGGEAVRTRWLAPADAPSLPMLPPTSFTLGQLAAFSTVEDALAAAAANDVSTPVMPHIHHDDDGDWLLL
jgi:8-oxo-dGTP pyrophosphatase MutT (NUDIX family)